MAGEYGLLGGRSMRLLTLDIYNDDSRVGTSSHIFESNGSGNEDINLSRGTSLRWDEKRLAPEIVGICR